MCKVPRPKCYLKANRCGAFTLIELLVVISIIALLLSVMMPALNKARKNAQAIQCMSNLRQIGTSVYSYSCDYKDRMPPGNFWNGTSIWVGYNGFGPVNLGQLLSGNYLEMPRGRKHVFYCPADKTDRYTQDINAPLSSARTFQNAWGQYNNSLVDFGYDFRDSMDGGQHFIASLAGQWPKLCKGIPIHRIANNVIVSDFYATGWMLQTHKDRYNLLCGDGSVVNHKDKYDPAQDPTIDANVTAWILTHRTESTYNEHAVFSRFDRIIGARKFAIQEPAEFAKFSTGGGEE